MPYNTEEIRLKSKHNFKRENQVILLLIADGKKSLKAPAIMYANLDCLLEKMHSCQNNSEKTYTEKIIKHTPSGYSLLNLLHVY